MKTPGCLLLTVALLTIVSPFTKTFAQSTTDRASLEKTSQAIRTAFARGDVAAILTYHHPDVVKALSYTKYLKGRDAVKVDLEGTLQGFTLEFKDNQVESLFIQGDTAIEQALFTIKGIPKKGGEPFFFKGRAQVVYVRYKQSPTGWASIREIIQPATE
ncbi:YybH family protein [Spirosoma jeollabukense]